MQILVGGVVKFITFALFCYLCYWVSSRKMGKVNKESRNHHYVPQCLLKNFSKQGKGKQIYVFDKLRSITYVSAIKNAGSENNFNTLEFNGALLNFEEIFQVNDNLTARIVQKILKSENLRELKVEEIYNLAEISLVQLLRTKLQRTSLVELRNQLRGVLQRAGLNPNDLNSANQFNQFSENDAKLIFLQHLGEIEQLIPLLVGKTILLLKTLKSKPFWISDNPVVFHNRLPYGEVGLGSRGVEIYFPISNTLCVAFLCPSIMLKMRREIVRINQLLNPSNVQQPVSQENYAYFIHPETLNAGSNVELINRLQVSSSSRFLYSSSNDFSLATHLLAKHPQLQNIRGKFQMSEMGKALPANERLPPGDVLVIVGVQEDYMLPIQYLEDEDNSWIRFFTSDLDSIKIIHNDSPFAEVKIYRNGQEIRGMSHAEFEDVNYTNIQPITIKHIDNEVNQFFTLIDRR